MDIEGTWNVTVSTPIGEQKSTLKLSSDRGSLVGTQASTEGEQPVYDVSLDGDQLAWKSDVTTPMPMVLSFSGEVSEDEMSGTVVAGPFPPAPFTADRS